MTIQTHTSHHRTSRHTGHDHIGASPPHGPPACST